MKTKIVLGIGALMIAIGFANNVKAQGSYFSYRSPNGGVTVRVSRGYNNGYYNNGYYSQQGYYNNQPQCNQGYYNQPQYYQGNYYNNGCNNGYRRYDDRYYRQGYNNNNYYGYNNGYGRGCHRDGYRRERCDDRYGGYRRW